MKIPGSQVPRQEGKFQVSDQAGLPLHTSKAAVSGVHSAKTAAFVSSRSVSALLSSLGLPVDRLSASVLAVARFFSLPLEPGFLAGIRRQAGLPGQAGQASQTGQGAAAERAVAGLELPAGEGVFKFQEALALAAAAAADKGLELTRAGLEEYATAIDPDRRGDGDGGSGGGSTGGTAGGNSGGAGNRGGGRGANADSREDDDCDGETAAAIAGDSAALREQMLAAGERSPLLALLNRLPGANGQRWIVLPFSFSVQGEQYRIALRILLDAGHNAGRLVMEIAKSGASEGRWLFNMDRAKTGAPRMEVLLSPPRRKGALKSIGEKLAALLGFPPESVSVQNGAEPFPLAENGGKNPPAINEEA